VRGAQLLSRGDWLVVVGGDVLPGYCEHVSSTACGADVVWSVGSTMMLLSATAS
jgi:hypothetical protein